MTHAHRKPHHVAHAQNADGSVNHTAVAAEMRHVADLLDAGKIQLRNASESRLHDGWDRITFERKLDPSLVDAEQADQAHGAKAAE